MQCLVLSVCNSLQKTKIKAAPTCLISNPSCCMNVQVLPETRRLLYSSGPCEAERFVPAKIHLTIDHKGKCHITHKCYYQQTWMGNYIPTNECSQQSMLGSCFSLAPCLGPNTTALFLNDKKRSKAFPPVFHYKRVDTQPRWDMPFSLYIYI